MSKNPGSDNNHKGRIRDVIEETFARYEPKEASSTTLVGVETRQVPHRELEPDQLMTIKVTEPAPLKIISTGITGLDNILTGGIADRSLILVAGETGSHYDTFVNQVIYNHVTENGKVVYYIAETLSIDIRQDMAKFGWNIKDFISKGTWIFANLRTKELQQLAALAPEILSDGTDIKLTQGLNALKTDLLNKIKEGIWTVLEIGHLLLNFDLKEVMELMLYWRTTIRVYGGIHFAILPVGIHPELQVNLLQHLADGVMEFHVREGNHDCETIMSIRKLRQLLRPQILTFTIEENGINIETAARIT